MCIKLQYYECNCYMYLMYTGKGQSTLDKFLHENPQAVIDGSNGDVACNSYYLYKQDASLMKDLGVSYSIKDI